MRAAYLDCSSGISGNMVIGALLDAGLPSAYLKKELNKLRVTRYALRVTKIKKHTLRSTYFNVSVKGEHAHRGLSDIVRIIRQSKLSRSVKAKSIMIFGKLAAAEAKVHGIPVNKVHFHEVGAVDAIIDIVGAAIGLEYLGIKETYCSPINLGSGKVKTAHGVLPVPAPATAELLKGIPVYSSDIKKELATPTGAAIISTLAKGFGPLPRLIVSSIGCGAGSYDLKEQPNVLRIIIGEKELPTVKDAVLQIEANVDDMDPRFYDHAIAAVMRAGALDAYISPIRMKKMRNAVRFTALCKIEDRERVLDAVFTVTTTFGVRVFLVEREKLIKRSFKTKFGRVKLGYLGKDLKTAAIEPDDYIKLKNKVPTPSPQPHPFWSIKN